MNKLTAEESEAAAIRGLYFYSPLTSRCVNGEVFGQLLPLRSAILPWSAAVALALLSQAAMREFVPCRG